MGSLSFQNFLLKFNLKNEAMSTTDIETVLKQLKLDGKTSVVSGLGKKYKILNLDNNTGSHWVLLVDDPFMGSARGGAQVGQYYFDSFGVQPPVGTSSENSKDITYSTYQVQLIDEKYCGAYCLYIIYLIEKEKLSFQQAVWKLYKERRWTHQGSTALGGTR